jgi:hypothetical protein
MHKIENKVERKRLHIKCRNRVKNVIKDNGRKRKRGRLRTERDNIE